MASTDVADIDLIQEDNFVLHCGRYWYGATWNEYTPTIKVNKPIPDAAFLFWALKHIGASPDYYKLLRAVQDYTQVGVNGWSIKNKGPTLDFEVYLVMYPPMVTQKYGREMPHMRLSAFEPDLNFFMRFEQEYFLNPLFTTTKKLWI